MIYEYALDPSLVVDWALTGIGRCVGQFGLDHRRLVSDFPKNWQGRVYEDFLKRFDYDYGHPGVSNNQPILDAYLQILTDCMVSRGIALPIEAVWLDEALKEHEIRPFHAIFTAPHGEDCLRLMTEKNIDDIWDVLWRFPTVKTTPKSAVDIALAVRPLLQAATNVLIIDPYFDAGAKRFQESLSQLLRQTTAAPRSVAAIPRFTVVTAVERAFKAGHAPTNAQERQKRIQDEVRVAWNILEQARRSLPSLIPSVVSLSVIVLRNVTGGDRVHNRFVLTDVGGVILPFGIDEYDRDNDHAAKDDLIFMPEGIFRERWSQFSKLGGNEVVLGPEAIPGKA